MKLVAPAIFGQPVRPQIEQRSSVLSLQMTQRTAVLVVLLVAVGVLVPMMCWGIPSGGDLPNHYRFAQPFYESIRSGHLYPGWLAESIYGFGDARFRFYPPGLYYLRALFRLVSGWYGA